jgi:hypothetical protein
MFFRKKQEKWQEVRWYSGPRDIYLALQFSGDEGGADRPTVERIASKDAAAQAAQPLLDESLLISTIESEVAEYNRRNRFDLRVAGIRYRAKGGADTADHGAAARKLLNLL